MFVPYTLSTFCFHFLFRFDKDTGDCELTVKPCGCIFSKKHSKKNINLVDDRKLSIFNGFALLLKVLFLDLFCSVIFQFQLFGSWGDPYYLGLNGLQFFDDQGTLIELSQKSILFLLISQNH